MRFVKPAVFLIGQWRPNNVEIYKWLEHIGCSPEVCEKYSGVAQSGEYASTNIASTKTSAERGVELAGRRCYLSFEPGLNPNVTKIRSEIKDYCDNIMKAKHGSVLEHFTYTFAIEGMSRVATAEMNRHRAGVAIS